jgi:transcriptional regulator with XRE-family HTH domain
VDVALRAGVAQSTVSIVEHGRIGRLQVSTVRAVAHAVGAEWDPSLRWRGGELDRLIDEAHATLVGGAGRRLGFDGWETRPEVTYSIYGERGSIDILAWHPGARMLLVVEVKTVLTSLEETLRRHDAKTRLALRIGRERCGWDASGVSSILVLPASSTSHRHVARHRAVLDAAYPLRGSALRQWLRTPRAPIAGLLFLSAIAPGAAVHDRATRSRVRRPAGRRADGPRPSPSAPSIPGDDP